MSYFTKPTIVAQITNYCDARCDHCFNAYHLNNVGSTAALDVDAFLSFVDRFDEQLCSKKPYVVISGGGEPTLHPRFGDLVQGLANRRVYFDVITNGMKWERWLEPLAKTVAVSYLHKAVFSVYGDEAVHNKKTGINSFKRIMSAIRFARKNKINCQLHMAIDKSNVDQVPTLARIVAEEDVNCGCSVYPAFPTTYLHDQGWVVDDDDLKLLRRYRDILGGGIKVFSVDPFKNWAGKFSCAEMDGDKFSVNYNGELSACCSLIGISFNDNKRDLFGHIKDKDLVETFSRREDIKSQFHKTYLRAVASKELDAYPLTKCSWCIEKAFDKMPARTPSVTLPKRREG